MNKTTRYLTGAAAVAGLGLILWFPVRTGWSVTGYALIALSILIQWIASRKELKKKK